MRRWTVEVRYAALISTNHVSDKRCSIHVGADGQAIRRLGNDHSSGHLLSSPIPQVPRLGEQQPALQQERARGALPIRFSNGNSRTPRKRVRRRPACRRSVGSTPCYHYPLIAAIPQSFLPLMHSSLFSGYQTDPKKLIVFHRFHDWSSWVFDVSLQSSSLALSLC